MFDSQISGINSFLYKIDKELDIELSDNSYCLYLYEGSKTAYSDKINVAYGDSGVIEAYLKGMSDMIDFIHYLK